MAIEYAGFSYPAEHKHQALERQTVKVCDNVYSFVGYGTSIFSLVIGKDGYSMVDVGDSVAAAEAVLELIKGITRLPLKNIFLTHSHPDHRGGGDVFLAENPDAPVWARENFGSESAGFKGIENITRIRGGRQFGAIIPAEKYTPNTVVLQVKGGKPGKPLMPNRKLEGPLQKVDACGVQVELHAIASETSDHMLVWLPETKVLFCGDTMYRSFPNLYPVRGSAYRDIAGWAAAVKKLLPFNAAALVTGHHTPTLGAGEVKSYVTNYGDALQYVYDETVKGIDAGKTPDELSTEIRLPDNLRKLPYLAEYYGAIPWAVRSIFSGLLGWFDGNASNLVPLAPKEEAEHMAKLAGGADKLLKNAREALQQKDWRWACQLADYLLQLGDAQEVKDIKAEALEEISKIVLPMSGKNYILSSALELHKK